MYAGYEFGQLVQIDSHEWIGNHHFMSQLTRHYHFDVSVFKLNDSGERELIRIEH